MTRCHTESDTLSTNDSKENAKKKCLEAFGGVNSKSYVSLAVVENISWAYLDECLVNVDYYWYYMK